MLSGLDPLRDSCERAVFCRNSTIDVNIWVTSCKVTKCYMQFGEVSGNWELTKPAPSG